MRFNVQDGDAGFVGINMVRERDSLEPGLLALGQNCRLRTRRARQRPGTTFPPDFNPAAGFGNYLVGSGVFRDPNGNELLMLAPANVEYTWHVAYGKDPVQINYDSGVTGDNGPGGGPNGVQFVQAFDKLILLRRPLQGSIGPPNTYNLVWDGDPMNEWDVMTLSATGRTLIPGMFNGEPFQNRVIYYKANAPGVISRDEWLVSDIGDYTSYDLIYQTIRTNSAEADFITRILGYFRDSVIVFKNHSIFQVIFQPTYPFSVVQRQLSTTLGSYGNKMPIEVGGDVFFLNAPGGFFRLSEVIQENIVTLPVAISHEIQPVIDQINWAVTLVHGCSAVLDNYVLFGVALGIGARALNTVLAYNTQSRQWESAGDTWRDPNFAFNALHVLDYYGAQRVFAIDYLNATVYLLYEGVNDDLKTGVWSVPYKIETRGYKGDDPVAWKRFFKAKVSISTSQPSVTITAITDGFNEEKNLTPVPLTKDRLKYYTHGTPDYNPLTDDPLKPKRKDYSVTTFENIAIEDFEELPDGPIAMLPGTSPPMVGDQQQSLERLVTRVSGRWISMRVENNEGVCDVLAVEVAGNKTMDSVRTAA